MNEKINKTNGKGDPQEGKLAIGLLMWLIGIPLPIILILLFVVPGC